ncbi:hypothetical protein HYPSUDRAFT_135172 [Hypholoma sublateritium FD-334 SS-4]|uniref:BTB domain-containing protein n=1 Tax=Hypholoma sublateritium (strain FD-334 SS-4) TaxID=945553 RepID=A0A0D2MM88_HYPSF|nr:hypothetical protein HYPSUDRAFT_135172 [Hypholoma sublateritium FD-334 SS-4]
MGPTVNTSDSDITICSGDGVLLYLHRTNLEAISGALAAPEFLSTSDDNVVALPESSEILGTVFLFIYPNRHPSLRDQDFETLLEISDAVQKYEIFAAMNTCETRLMEAIPMHSTDILLHALRHNLTDIINESVLALCRLPVVQTAELLQPIDVLPWVSAAMIIWLSNY